MIYSLNCHFFWKVLEKISVGYWYASTLLCFFWKSILTRLILFQAELIKKQQEDLLRNQWEVEKLEEQRQLMEKERKKQELG